MQRQATSNRISTAEVINSVYLLIRHQLELKRDQVYDEIRSYTPPIPACDVQFNTLLETRSSVARELSRLNSLEKQSLRWHEQMPLLTEFITTSTCLTDDLKQTLCTDLQQIQVNGELEAA